MLASSFVSTFKKAPVHMYIQHPRTFPRAVVVFFHGLGMHATAERYRPFYQHLVDNGYIYAAWDCPHHGKSSSLDDPTHPLKPLDIAEPNLVLDAVAFVDVVRAQCTGLPLILIGESLGGGLALRIAPFVHPDMVITVAGLVSTYAIRQRPLIAGLLGGIQLVRTSGQVPSLDLQKVWIDRWIPKRPIPMTAVKCQQQIVRRTAYADIQGPVVMIVGHKDDLYSVRDSIRTLSKLSDSGQRFLVPLDTGHNMMGCSTSEQIAHLCQSYIQDILKL